jgi:hypothetical protein
MVNIGLDGKVISAKAVGGHPLHRKVSENAALRFEFDSTSIKSEIELPLRFIFIDGGETKDNIERFKCDYRIVINAEPVLIDVTEVD